MIIGLLGLLVARVLLAWLIPPVADESYYMLWANHLDFSYVDHPGMIAWMLSVANTWFSNPLFSARFVSFICCLGTLGFLYATLRLTVSANRALQGLFFFLCIPYMFVVGMLMQVEQPLLLFASMMLYGFAQWLKTEKPVWVMLAAVGFGLGFLSKYSILVMAVGLLWMIFRRDKSHLLKTKGFAVAVIIGIASILPVLVWNSQHSWMSFAFQAGRIGEARWFEHTLAYLGDQLLYWSPVGAWFAWRYRKNDQDSMWGFLSVFILIFFGLISIKTKVYAHWTALGLLPFTLWMTESLPDMKALNKGMLMFTAVLSAVLLLVSPGIGRKQLSVMENSKLEEQLKVLKVTTSKPVYLYGDSHGAVGILSYYAKEPVYFPRGFLAKPGLWGEKQFGLWDQPVIYPGEHVVFYTRWNTDLEEKLKTKFEKVYPLPWKLTLLEDHISEKTLVMCLHAKEALVF